MKKIQYGCLLLGMTMFLTACGQAKNETATEDKKKNTEVETESNETAGLTSLFEEEVPYVTEDYIMIEKQDFDPMTEDDYNRILSVEGIERAELYGTINRIHYYYPGSDNYSWGTEEISNGDERKQLTLEYTEQTMRSAEGLTEDALAAGNLPEQMDEIVVYAEDEAMIGETVELYLYDWDYYSLELEYGELDYGYLFKSECDMGAYIHDGYFLTKEFTITGILKEKTSQIYFAPDYCEMLSKSLGGTIYSSIYVYTSEGEEGEGFQEFPGEFGLDGDVILGMNENLYSNMWRSNLTWNTEAEHYAYLASNPRAFLVVYDEDCEEDEFRISEYLLDNYYNGSEYRKLSPVCLFWSLCREEVSVEEGKDTWIEDELGAVGYAKRWQINGYQYQQILMKLSTDTHSQGVYVLEVGKEMFDRCFGEGESYEIAIFLDEGSDREQVLASLEAEGYQVYRKKTNPDIQVKLTGTYELYTEDEEGNDIVINQDNYKEYLEDRAKNEDE